MIKTEDEVDADAEDSAVAGALADADKTEIQKLQTTSGNAKVGIDVSKWNGTIDWDKVKMPECSLPSFVRATAVRLREVWWRIHSLSPT